MTMTMTIMMMMMMMTGQSTSLTITVQEDQTCFRLMTAKLRAAEEAKRFADDDGNDDEASDASFTLPFSSPTILLSSGSG